MKHIKSTFIIRHIKLHDIPVRTLKVSFNFKKCRIFKTQLLIWKKTHHKKMLMSFFGSKRLNASFLLFNYFLLIKKCIISKKRKKYTSILNQLLVNELVNQSWTLNGRSNHLYYIFSVRISLVKQLLLEPTTCTDTLR